MASSSHRGATTSSSQGFYDHLKSLQEEFELLKLKVDLLSLENEALWEERNKYKEKYEDQMEELQDVRRNFVCERCIMTTNPQIAASRGVDLSQETTTCWTQRAIILAQPSESVSLAISERSETTFVNSEAAALPSPSPQASTSTDSGSEGRNWSIIFNNEVERELDVEIKHTLSHGKPIGCVKFTRDGKYVAAGCVDRKAYIYDVQTGTLIRTLGNLLAVEDLIEAVCFSHDGKYLATGTSVGGIYIWEIETKYVRNAFKGHTRLINSLDFSPNGRMLVSTSSDNTVRTWDMHDGATMLLMEENPTILDDPCYVCAVFSPCGMYVAASHRDGMVRIWDVCKGQLMRRMMAHAGWVICVAFTQDGKGLVSGSDDTKLRYWDVSSLDSDLPMTTNSKAPGVEELTRPEREFIGHRDSIDALAISPDDRWVASSSHDKSVRIWDADNAVMQCALNHDDELWAVDFSPAGCYLATGGKDCTLRIWMYSESNIASTTRDS